MIPVIKSIGIINENRINGIAFEYQGSHVYGHPNMWENLPIEEQKKHPLYQKWMEDLEKWKESAKHGIETFFIMSDDYKEWNKNQQSNENSLLSYFQYTGAFFNV